MDLHAQKKAIKEFGIHISTSLHYMVPHKEFIVVILDPTLPVGCILKDDLATRSGSNAAAACKSLL